MVLEIMPNISFFLWGSEAGTYLSKVVPLVEEPIMSAGVCLSPIVVLIYCLCLFITEI